MAWLPQEAQAALNPFLRLQSQLAETLRAARDPADTPAALFAAVGLDAAMLRRYPHQLSGGQAQRAALACALAQGPEVLVADEPTSALDPRIADAILRLLDAAAQRRGLSLVLITHDLAAAIACDRLLVLDAGTVVESGSPGDVLAAPHSPAAASLVEAFRRLSPPRLDRSCSAPAA